MKKLEKAFKKVFGIKNPSEMRMSTDVPSLYPHSLSINVAEARKAQESLYKSLINRAYGAAATAKINPIEEPQKEDTQTKDEWIWVNGYKATDKDMKCRDYQYEMHKQFDMPEDAEISICSSGFHLCTKLKDTFNYYQPCDGNRYFHVRALVRKSDLKTECVNELHIPSWYYTLVGGDSKLAAKSIEFVSEVSREEFEHALLKGHINADKLSPEFLTMVPNISVNEALQKQKTHELEEAGYPYRLAKYIMKYGNYDKAMDLATIDTITLDTKVLLACGVGSIEED